MRAAQEAIIASREGVTSSRERLALAEGRYQAGAGSVIELGDAQGGVVTAEAQQVAAEYRLAIAQGAADLRARAPVNVRSRRASDDSVAAHRSVCNYLHMATNLAIDDELLNEALRVGGQRTKKETVNQALREFVQRRKQAKILDLFGKVDFDPKYDYKRQRRRS